MMPPTLSYSPSLSRIDLRQWLQILRQLARTELSTMVALSGLAGSLLASGRWSGTALLCSFAIWLLAAGCSALNQWQEQDLDARMLRTCQRPLPAGQLRPSSALIFAALCLLGGLLLLSLLPGQTSLLLGLLAVIWYNGIYTPLKRKTPFAALPGALCGALPPLIGWTATGHPLLAPEGLILAGTLFLWQIPHSWLLLCRYREDLQRSGLPNLFKYISTPQLLRINHSWLAALGGAYLLFPMLGYVSSPTLSLLLIAGVIGAMAFCIKISKAASSAIAARRLFHLTNISMALLLLILIVDNL